MGNVGNPLAIARDFGFARRHPGEQDGKLLRLAIQADQIEAALLADHEKLLSIKARDWIAEHQRPYRKLGRLSAGFMKQRSTFMPRPYVLGGAVSGFEEEVF